MTRSHILTLDLRRPPMSSNDQRRAHWTKVRQAKTAVELFVTAAARNSCMPVFDRCHVTVVWHAPDGRVRDSDSLAPLLKAALDALVRGKWLVSDDHRHVLSTKQVVVVDRVNPRITIEVEEAA